MMALLLRDSELAGDGLVAHKRDDQRVLAIGHTRQVERTVRVSDAALNHLFTFRQLDIHKLQRFVSLFV